MYLYNTRSASNLGAYRRPRPLRSRRLRGLAGAVPGAAPNLTPSQMSTAGSGGATDPDQSLIPYIPGSTPGDILYNAVYGNLSPNQQANLVSQEQAQLVTAGATPSDATTTANTDVSETLDSFTGPGGFGVTWTGAAPDQPGFPTAAADAVANAASNALLPTLSAVPSWVWWAAGGIGGLILFGIVKRAL